MVLLGATIAVAVAGAGAGGAGVVDDAAAALVPRRSGFGSDLDGDDAEWDVAAMAGFAKPSACGFAGGSLCGFGSVREATAVGRDDFGAGFETVPTSGFVGSGAERCSPITRAMRSNRPPFAAVADFAATGRVLARAGELRSGDES